MILITSPACFLPRPTSTSVPTIDRTRAGPTAPPHGLCLMEVRYDGSAEADPEETIDEN